MLRTPLCKYTIVGAAAFVIDYTTTALLTQVLPLIVANTLGFALANMANFALAHTWVFGGRHALGTIWRAYLAVLSISIVGLAINDAVVWIAVARLGSPLLAAKVAATGVALLWNYFARTTLVYRKHKE